MSRLKVTLYSDAAYYGGAEVYLSILARHLDPERIELSALLPDDPPVPRLEEELAASGAAIHRFRRPGLRWWSSLSGLQRTLAGIGGDVLHINLPSTYDAGISSVAVAAKLSGYRRVLTTEHLPMIRRRYRKFPAKVVFSEAIDSILVPARATREYVVRLHHMPWDRTRIVPYGVEEAAPVSADAEAGIRRATGTPAGTLTLGIVGRLTPRKGHRFLFEALSALHRRRRLPELRLWVVGEGEERESLDDLAHRMGLDGIVRFTGPRTDAAALMKLLDILVVPSLVETTPFVILEAMAAGRPVVASSIYGIPEMIDDGVTGYLVPPGEPEPLARALAQLIESPEKRLSQGEKGRERFAAIFTADRMARSTEAAYFGRDREDAA